VADTITLIPVDDEQVTLVPVDGPSREEINKVSFGGGMRKSFSPSKEPTVAEKQRVVGITSESDKAARREVDYIRENAGNIVVPVPALAAAGVVKGVGGKVRQVGDVVGADGVAKWGADLAQSGADVEKRSRRNTRWSRARGPTPSGAA